MISVLVEHVSLLAELIKPLCKHVIVLTGSASTKEISEGFDLPRLYTLFLAQPVSYKGLVAQ